MKTKFKDLMLYTFAGIGICAILMATTNTPQQTTSTVPESHVWTMQTAVRSGNIERVYALNKVTGEMRKYSSKDMRRGNTEDQYYQVMTPNQKGEK